MLTAQLPISNPSERHAFSQYENIAHRLSSIMPSIQNTLRSPRNLFVELHPIIVFTDDVFNIRLIDLHIIFAT
jgi:hypothetical protein